MNICVFGSSSEHIDKIYLESAKNLGKFLAEKNYGVIFGAGKYGVMGETAKGVSEKNGVLIGVSPRFFIEDDVIYDKCTELIFTDTMRERKAIMEEKADAFVICAGGIGTFEEFFEVITLKQLNRHNKPIIIYNINGYYNPLIAMLQNAVDQKFMSAFCNKLYTVAENEQEIIEQIEKYVPFTYNKYKE